MSARNRKPVTDDMHTNDPRARSWLSVTAIALLVGLVVLAPKLAGIGASPVSMQPAAAPTPAASADPVALAAALDRAAAGKGFRLNAHTQAMDSQNNAIAGSDRGFANRWVTSASAASGQELSLIVISEPFMSLEQVQADCQARLAAGHALTCVASVVDDMVVQDIERAAERFSDGWPVATADRWESLGADLWFLHQSIVRSPNGTTVYAHEAARSRTVDAARSAWLLSSESLRSTATELAFPLWHDTTQCGWVIASKRNNNTCVTSPK